MTLTKEKRDKLARLKKIAKDVPDSVITDPRETLKLAFRLGVIDHWTDTGNFYMIGFPNHKTEKVRVHSVAEFVADKILSVKDPLNETIEKDPLEELLVEEEKDNPEQESEKDFSEEPLNYDELTVAELKELCKNRELSGYSTLKKDELVTMLELDDSGVSHK